MSRMQYGARGYDDGRAPSPASRNGGTSLTSPPIRSNYPPPPSSGASSSHSRPLNDYGSASRGGAANGMGQEVDSTRETARTHWAELASYLRPNGSGARTGAFRQRLSGAEPPGNRSNAREKLTRLTKQQFLEVRGAARRRADRRSSAPTSTTSWSGDERWRLVGPTRCRSCRCRTPFTRASCCTDRLADRRSKRNVRLSCYRPR